MKILAGEPTGKAGIKARSIGVGCMVCTSRKQHLAGNRHLQFEFTAVDNGAFGCYRSGRPFNDDLFLMNVDKVNDINLNPLFIVCPDIVAGGIASLEFSLNWRSRVNYHSVALVIQDGMEFKDVSPVINDFQYIFIGGSVKWKWENAEKWVKFSHDNNLPCHIGQCGQLWMLHAANRFGADSVDSTSWVVNKSWHIIEEFQNPKQMELELWD